MNRGCGPDVMRKHRNLHINSVWRDAGRYWAATDCADGLICGGVMSPH